MPTADPIAELRDRLPRHWRLLEALRNVVTKDDRLRWLELGCSLGAGGGDELSDADVGIGYTGITGPEQLAGTGRAIATGVGTPIEMIAHRMEGWSDEQCRIAEEYVDGVQLDLVMIPAMRRPGLPDRTLALVDKDDQLAAPWVPESRRAPSVEVAHEWVVLGWWALSAADKYIARGSLFEAVEAIAEARNFALRLCAVGGGVPYPSFGLVSLLDFPPYEPPDGLSDTYCSPANRGEVVGAALDCARLLRDAMNSAGTRLGARLGSALADTTSRRLAER